MLAWPQGVVEQVVSASAGKSLWLAYSGGIDSHVLLHCLAQSSLIEQHRLHAVHINHHLHPESSQWAQHCADRAKALSVDFHCIDVTVSEQEKVGLEAAARQARYEALQSHVGDGDIILTAQHQQDQAETVLLQLLRGAGPKGLASMPLITPLGDAILMRPLLSVSKADIIDYAQQHQLQWVDDPSNLTTTFDRNYLRHRIWPELVSRWPSAAKTMSRSASHCAEADTLLTELADIDLAAFGVTSIQAGIPVSGLLALSPARARNVLRRVVQLVGLPLPTTTVLQRILDEVCLADEDKMPEVILSGGAVRRYRDRLFFLPADEASYIAPDSLIYRPESIVLSSLEQLTWQLSSQGIPQRLFEQGLRLAYRQGGERIQLLGRQHHHQLKQLWQEWGIPPWQRCRIPLLFCEDQLVAVVGYGLSQDCALAPDEQGYLPVIVPRH